jgi:sulfatase maturation enzyme AslB (radical SAM superfamily)
MTKTFPIESSIIGGKLFPEKNLIGKYCLSPFISISIDLSGNVFLCGCIGWHPTSIGNLFQSSIDTMLSSKLAIDIRQSITDGSYKFCNELRCSIIRNNLLNDLDTVPPTVAWQIQDPNRYMLPSEITIAGDTTCNLSCPSCRTQVLKISDKFKQQQEELGEILKNNLFSKPTDQTITIQLSTTGELFASPMLLKFVSSISVADFPNIFLNIQSNGLLCKQTWHKLNEMQDHVKKITITVDAAESHTYEKLRRGGEWPKLLESLAWLSQKKKQNGMAFHTRMVVQRDNIDQLEKFYHLSKQFDVDVIEYGRIGNWSTYSSKEFKNVDILDPAHPKFQHATQCLKNIMTFKDTLTYG